MADRIIKVDDKFNPVTVTDFYNSPLDDCRIVILSSRDVTVLRAGLVPLYWATRFGEWVSPSRFRVVDNADLIGLLESLEVKLMGCDIATSLNNIASAIELLARSQCCEQGDVIVNVNGGINGSLSDGSVTYGTEPYSEVPETTPEGYEDNNQYESQKCAMAHAMVSDVVYLLSVLSGASGISAIGGLVVAVLGILAIISIPQVVIPTLISVVAIAFLAGGTLYAVSLEVEAHRQDIVCALLLNDNLDLVMESLADIFDVIIASVGASSPVGAAIKTILLILFNSETVNKLYAAYAGFMYPQADCSGCEEVDCGEGGELQHFPVFSAVTDGSFSVDGDEITINGTVSQGQDGYRYSIWSGGEWGSAPYPALAITELVSVNQTLTGDEGGGYITVLDENGSPVYGASSLGTADIAAFNESLAESPACVSVMSVAYAPSPVTMVFRFLT